MGSVQEDTQEALTEPLGPVGRRRGAPIRELVIHVPRVFLVGVVDGHIRDKGICVGAPSSVSADDSAELDHASGSEHGRDEDPRNRCNQQHQR